MPGLAEAVHNAVGQPSSVRIGIIDSIEPPVVSAQGVPFEDVGFIDGYVPVVGDSVALLGQSSEAGSDPASWLALGKVVPSADVVTPDVPQAGIANVTITAATSGTLIVSFDTPYDTTPAISVNINSGAGATSQWHSRAINAVTTGFTIFLFGPASSFTVPVMWQAQPRTQ
jgi:hypothetical protein